MDDEKGYCKEISITNSANRAEHSNERWEGREQGKIWKHTKYRSMVSIVER
uniref:Uncharacterized protein n=1 Tax=Anopheles minimus TaxID=112268 RepID=A0A182WMQ7_9DIPT